MFDFGGPFLFGICVFMFFFVFRVSGCWAFVAFVAFHFASSAFTPPLCLSLWVHAAFAALAFRILCIASLAAADDFLAFLAFLALLHLVSGFGF